MDIRLNKDKSIVLSQDYFEDYLKELSALTNADITSDGTYYYRGIKVSMMSESIRKTIYVLGSDLYVYVKMDDNPIEQMEPHNFAAFLLTYEQLQA